MFAFLVLSTGPGPREQGARDRARGRDLFDATVIRALLVPALCGLLGDWNWWMPKPVARALFIRERTPAAAPEAA